ncbi:MAG TPA: TetR/AcrR family transcriptional regulator [Anaerolineales bacterium]|nr:TetR/AcrR family transcriptional regulator [Anaerolineales bacterium]
MNEELTRGENTRLEIVQAAHKLFIGHGYHGTSMRQIAQTAGIALGSIYNHFSSKEDVFVAVLKAHHPYHEILSAAESAHGDTLEAFLGGVAAQMVAALARRPEFLNLMLIEIVEFNSRHVPTLFAEVFPEFATFSKKFTSMPGRLRPIPVLIVMRAFVGLFFSYYITEALIGEQIPAQMKENALEHFVDIFLYGVLDRGHSGSAASEE